MLDDEVGGAPSTVSGRSRYLPAFLDALIPGLGHLQAGRRRRALLFLSPVIIALGALVFVVATTSSARLGASLLDTQVIWALLALQGLLLVWRLLAVASSLTAPGLPNLRRSDAAPIVALVLVVVIVPQVFAGYATEVTRESLDEIFVEASPVAVGPSAEPEPDPSFLVPAPSASASASASATPSPTPAIPRINVLIVGVDSAPNRNTYGTDTMIVASLDPVDPDRVDDLDPARHGRPAAVRRAEVLGGKINGLVSYARRHPKQFPGSDGSGFDVLLRRTRYAPGTRHQVPRGRQPRRVRPGDRHARWHQRERCPCDLRPEQPRSRLQHGGSRSRPAATTSMGPRPSPMRGSASPSGESDFTRAARQQEVLSGIRDKLIWGGFVNDPIGLLKALAKTITTNVPRKLLPDLAEATTEIGRKQDLSSVISRPLVRGTSDRRGSVQIPDLKRHPAAAPPRSSRRPGRFLPAKYKAPKKMEGSRRAAGSQLRRGDPEADQEADPKPTKKPTPKPTAAATPSRPRDADRPRSRRRRHRAARATPAQADASTFGGAAGLDVTQ